MGAKVLGVDPGVSTTGYAVVSRRGSRLTADVYGVIRTPPSAPLAERLAALRAALADLIATHGPDSVSVERVFFNNNVRTAMSVGQASGVALVSAAEAGIEVSDYTPSQVKRAVVGVGNATKAQVQAMVASILGLSVSPSPVDAADACALAICALNGAGLKRALERAAT